MANMEHLNILKQGADKWNEWRDKNPFIPPNLSYADLTEMNLVLETPVDVEGPMLIRGINLRGAILAGANLSGAQLIEANLKYANLNDANLSESMLFISDLTEAQLTNTNLHKAQITGAIFGNIDLSNVKGLDTVIHRGPSTVGVDTLYKSAGNIPESFLRGCGIPDEFIAYLPSLAGAKQAIQFYSCFISYSSKDEEFARRLHSRMREASLRVWFAPEDVRGGEKLREQIDRAIQLHDRLLVVLSENSLQSKWVETEIRRARKVEQQEKRRKLFPIRLVSYERLMEWECFDADTGEDLAREVRDYYIRDFSNWKEHDAFEAEFDKLLKDLQAAETGGERQS